MNDPKLYELVSLTIEEKLRRAMPQFTECFPHITTLEKDGLLYRPEENTLWTASFFPGMLYLAYDRTGNTAFLADVVPHLKSFRERLEKRVRMTHDLGFLYTLSCVALYKLTGNQEAKELAQQAADLLAERYNEKGHFIQAWGEIGIGTPYVQMIADTMLNLPLLFWSQNPKHHQMAAAHAQTCAKYLVRSDFSSYHTYWMDPKSGQPIRGGTHQGFRDETTWARGQAWIVLGFALAYAYTKNPVFLLTAQRAAEVFRHNLPADGIPYWDFAFTDAVPDIKDSSAAAIYVCGLLELARHTPAELAGQYHTQAQDIVKKLYEHCFVHDLDTLCLLKDGMYHRETGATGTIWGDYFFYEALVRLQKNWDPF